MAVSGSAPLRAGDLRRKLVIQQRPATKDAYNQPTGAWSTVLTTWGRVQAKQGTALMQVLAGQQMPSSAYLITLRYPPSLAIKAGMQIVDGAATYVVQNVIDVDERHRVLTLTATQVPAPGA